MRVFSVSTQKDDCHLVKFLWIGDLFDHTHAFHLESLGHGYRRKSWKELETKTFPVDFRRKTQQNVSTRIYIVAGSIRVTTVDKNGR